jgi:hypothetical protein
LRQNRPAAKRKKKLKLKKRGKNKLSDSVSKFIDKIHKAPWQCPNYECGKKHSKLHYAFPGQVDHKKMVMEEGRVKYGREEGKDIACGIMKDEGAMDKMKKLGKSIMNKEEIESETGPAFDKDGNPSPLFCPHCGWEEELVIILKVK